MEEKANGAERICQFNTIRRFASNRFRQAFRSRLAESCSICQRPPFTHAVSNLLISLYCTSIKHIGWHCLHALLHWLLNLKYIFHELKLI